MGLINQYGTLTRGMFPSGATLPDLKGSANGVLEYISQYPPAFNSTYVKATTSTNFNDTYPPMSTDPNLSLLGSSFTWMSFTTANNRFHIDLGSAKIIKRVYYENAHQGGLNPERGAKNFTLWGSNDSGAFADLVYSHDTNWTQLTIDVSQFVQHPASDIVDPHYIMVTNSVAYRYYALKIADNWGGSYVGIRRIELQTLPISGNTNGYLSFIGGNGTSIGRRGIAKFTRTTFDYTYNTDFSFVCIFRSNKADALIHTLFANAIGTTAGYIKIRINASEQIEYELKDSNSKIKTGTGAESVCDGKIHIFSMTYNKTSNVLICQIEGKAAITNTTNDAFTGNLYSANSVFSIGAALSEGNNYLNDGTFDLFGLINIAGILTPADIQNIISESQN